MITDVEYRLGLARKMGVTRAVNVAKREPERRHGGLGMTEGFDVGLEMSGAPPVAFRTMLDTMNHGGQPLRAGVPPSELCLSTGQSYL